VDAVVAVGVAADAAAAEVAVVAAGVGDDAAGAEFQGLTVALTTARNTSGGFPPGAAVVTINAFVKCEGVHNRTPVSGLRALKNSVRRLGNRWDWNRA
jgi:hypothetical protein